MGCPKMLKKNQKTMFPTCAMPADISIFSQHVGGRQRGETRRETARPYHVILELPLQVVGQDHQGNLLQKGQRKAHVRSAGCTEDGDR